MASAAYQCPVWKRRHFWEKGSMQMVWLAWQNVPLSRSGLHICYTENAVPWRKPITWTGRVLPRFLLSAWSSWVNKYLWKQQVISSMPSNLCNYYCSSCTVVENIHKQYSHCVNNFMVYFVNLRGANHWNTCSSTQAVSTAGKLQPTDLTQYQCQPLLLRST